MKFDFIRKTYKIIVTEVPMILRQWHGNKEIRSLNEVQIAIM